VFKWGRRAGLVDFDYADAPSALRPWRASFDDVCREDPESPIWEFPIYAERRWALAFLSANRLYRAWLGFRHRLPADGPGGAPVAPREPLDGRRRRARPGWLQKHAWKADFNQCTGRQLIGAARRAERLAQAEGAASAPFVLIGHSKLFTPANERSLERFLRFAATRAERFRFATYGEALASLAAQG
jgi:hypothetical protein